MVLMTGSILISFLDIIFYELVIVLSKLLNSCTQLLTNILLVRNQYTADVTGCCYYCPTAGRHTNSAAAATTAHAVAAAVAPQCTSLQWGSSSSSHCNDIVAPLPPLLWPLLLPHCRLPHQLCCRCCHCLSAAGRSG
jgi:hypothetical protein